MIILSIKIATDTFEFMMMFNAFLIFFDIRNITQISQWAYSFNGTPVIKLQPIVSSILGHVFSIVESCLHFYGTKSQVG